ncbi:MAG: SBBP repeat-containing protein, partial [Ignavibacteria bacterium]|nr:SBBP repeat-containing protein [Ignavibacteria bacterium]
MNFVNYNETCEIEKEGGFADFENFYLANCPQGVTGVRAFSRITYRNVYNGIDLTFYFSNGKLKYDFIISPRADPNDICFEYIGAKKVLLNNEGTLEVTCPLGKISDNKPVAFLSNGNTIEAEFVIFKNTVKFQIADYDRSNTLTIDPQVYWSTYFGGSIGDHLTQIKIDRVNDIVITGFTLSDDFPATAGAFQTKRTAFFDVIIAKFNSNGNKVWATYYGGSETDYGQSVFTDKDTKLYVVGYSWSNDLPLSLNCYQPNYAGGDNDGFLLKFDNLGRREWATYVGGDRNDH